ncbi:MAG: PTS sugar transporter subunit IIB [Elusimicrobiota bacterium]|nr:PTS sugar transporter subunit IIB [Elusimicrobiota bacterium]
MIKSLRIDSRLIHGQIVEGWLKLIMADEVLIIDDFIRESPFEKKILRFALPPEIDLEVLSITEAAARWTEISASSKRFFILLQSVDMLSRFYGCLLGSRPPSPKLPPVNLGLINFTDSKTLLTKAVYLDEREREQIRFLIESGVEIYAQALPSNEKTPVVPLLKAGDAKSPEDNNE